VQLADQAAVVAGVGEIPGEQALVRWQPDPVGPQAVGVHVLSGHQAAPGRAADRALHVTVLEQRALAGETVEVRRADLGIVVGGERVEPLLVRAEKQDVRLLGPWLLSP
jgi:hypothetical protein